MPLASKIKFLAASPRRAFLLARMAFWIAAATVLIERLSLPEALRFIAPKKKHLVNNASRAKEETAQLVDRLLKLDFWVYKPICWRRAAALYRFLALDGIESEIVFGAKKNEQNILAGHAWLEIGGEPVLEKEPPDYKVTFRFPQDEKRERV